MSIPPSGAERSLGDIAQAVDRAQAERAEKNAREISFDDFVDFINPLQHLPIVSTVYRALSGDEISPQARAIGGAIYGGPAGMISAGVAMAIEEGMGDTPADMLARAIGDDAPETAAQAAEPNPRPPTETIAAAPTLANATPNAPSQTEFASKTAPAEQRTTAAPAPRAPEPPPATLPFVAKNKPRMFSLARDPAAAPVALTHSANAANAAKAAQSGPAAATPVSTAAPAPPAPIRTPASPPAPALSASQGALLDKFIAGGAQSSAGLDPTAPINGKSAEWIAMQMQANLQKYAEAQQAESAR